MFSIKIAAIEAYYFSCSLIEDNYKISEKSYYVNLIVSRYGIDRIVLWYRAYCIDNNINLI